MQVLPPPPASRGPDILTNPVILESILPELPHLSDILSLQRVSHQLYLLVQPLHPLSAREISLANLPHIKNRDLITVLHRSLRPGPSIQRRLLADGRTVTVGEGMGKAYVGPWRFLRVITLSGTNITSKSVKLLIAASSGGKIPGLPELPCERRPGLSDPEIGPLSITSGFFAKEFGVVSPGAYRLLADQSLRLDKLCVTNCRAVDITDINNFLKKILIVVTAPRRRELRLRASQLAAAQQQQNAPPANPNAPPGFVAAQHMQQQAQPVQEDLSSIPYPLPATVDELADFGLPCLSLRRLEVANVDGLWVDPPERFRGKREWGYAKDCPFNRNIGSLNSIAGCLGLDVDVLFCQGAGCATSSDNSRWRQSNPHGFDFDDFDAFDGIIPDLTNAQEHNPQVLPHNGESLALVSSDRYHRRTYHYPLPRLPGERILMTEDGRVFRIPRHAIPNQRSQAAQAQQQQQALNLFQAAMNAQPLGQPTPGGTLGGAAVPVPVPPLPPVPPVAVNVTANMVGANQNAWNAWATGLGGGNGGNGGGGGVGSTNGWASNLFLQDPAQYGLAVWHQPQQQDNQAQASASAQALMQTFMQNLPGATTTVQPYTTPVTVTVTPQHPQQDPAGSAHHGSPVGIVDAGTNIAAAINTDMADFSQGDDDLPDQDNSTIVANDTTSTNVDPPTDTPENGDGPSTAFNGTTWPSLLSVDADGVQTPPYNQQLPLPASSWNPTAGLHPFVTGISSVAGPSSTVPPPPPTPTPAVDPDLAWTSYLAATTDQTTDPSQFGGATAGPFPHPNPLPFGGAPQPISDSLHLPYPPLAPVAQDPATTVGTGNVATNTNAIFTHLAQTQNVSLPRRRNNSPGGSRGGAAQNGVRPGRRIAMLDGPRGLCEGCGREVWLCDSCNRYWVVTCGGCAAKQ